MRLSRSLRIFPFFSFHRPTIYRRCGIAAGGIPAGALRAGHAHASAKNRGSPCLFAFLRGLRPSFPRNNFIYRSAPPSIIYTPLANSFNPARGKMAFKAVEPCFPRKVIFRGQEFVYSTIFNYLFERNFSLQSSIKLKK